MNDTARRLRFAVFLSVAAITPLALSDEPSGDNDRYGVRDPSSLCVARKPVMRKGYVDFVRPEARGFESGPDRAQYGPRHALPALAVFSLEGDRKLGEGIKKTLRHYADWVQASIDKEQGVFSMEGATLCALHFRELRKAGLIRADDEPWIRRLFLNLRAYHFAWRPGDGFWRGPHHRSQAQGINHALAAALYPDEPGVASWKEYADRVWSDWWDYRDVGINDSGYFYSSFSNILRAAELLGRKEVFTDPESRQLFDRIVGEITSDGAGVPYGASGGYHGQAGACIFALELAARYTRDGRYRWVASRIMNFGQQRGFSRGHHHLQAVSHEFIALASLVCDDSVAPVEPDGGSQLLWRKEIVRLTDDQAREMFPDAGGVDCNMITTQRKMPHKLAFRSGWNPGDMYMLVECFPRHDPLNPTAIVSLERDSASFAEMTPEKFVSRENAVSIQDLSGTGSYLGRNPFAGARSLPLGWDGMEVRVPVVSDHDLATHARIDVDRYMGYEATHRRELLFVKNRFVLVRDETQFDDRFQAAVGPVWNTQCLGTPRGRHWMNTWFRGHFFQGAQLYESPPWDLLVYYAPRSDAQLVISDAPIDTPFKTQLVSTQYRWQGDVQSAVRLQFVTVLLPHAPMRDATPVAERIRVLVDRPGCAAVEIAQPDRCELAILHPPGQRLELTCSTGMRITTDAKAAYLDRAGGSADRILVRQATFLEIGDRQIFRDAERRDWETTDVGTTQAE
ncbi:MAG TPA: hypothetical protein VMY37_06060 [Thermoguttaceae bacterium]|nr:hypothetical protein [Thermoguttaceae bacterium]